MQKCEECDIIEALKLFSVASILKWQRTLVKAQLHIRETLQRLKA